MWTREHLKTNAKMVLRRSFWLCFAVCIIAMFLGAGGGNGTTVPLNISVNLMGNSSPEPYYYDSWDGYGYPPPSQHYSFWDYLNPFALLAMGWALVIALAVAAVGLLFTFFVSGPVSVGKSRFFIQNRNSYGDLGIMFSPFRSGEYLSIVKTMALQKVYIFLWSLLLVIPGIVKSYAYCMVPYILAENPNIGVNRAIQLSEAMTRGEKWNIFVLDLSFFGWYFLGALACGIGTLFVNPYVEATYTELYGVLRYRAISEGLCHPSELGDTPYQGQ